ncbi:uncharacterized protein UV8b_06669 [Ustilaginoidea virens]|uniref:C2H2-type domain-containing protein n=1 Tax=Ustilaginoidea virens TaxID=1159556 RepID=A0A8E5MJA8_USTVR|nr:uncharacterized protein UV8b_06669 [Ustilaginoidea virens]QUC22428.1 hypothetical protein UV8b_06669 [Ustilaginoidea virens]
MSATNSTNPDEGEFLCKPCHRSFATWEALLQHKAYKRKTGAKDHIHCQFCGRDFETEEAQGSHIKQNHPKDQVLKCPGCGQGPFPRLSSLISHIETGDCARIDTCTIDELREKKLEFPRRLERLTKEAVKNNYTNFALPKPSAGSYRAEPDAKDSALQWAGSDSLHLPVESGKNTAAGNDGGNAARDGEAVAWNEQMKLHPDAQAVEKKPAPSQEGAERVLHHSTDPDDPDSPGFNAARYYSDIIGQYICPKNRCGKVFKKKPGLVNHLRSPAHSDRQYRCPYCLRPFKSLTAITAHVESSSVSCRIRETDGYGAFVDQLTAGMVDVGKSREDGTLQYSTSDTWLQG